ncbi:MAG: tetratricopeptide repeat protein, partial [Acidobacteriaceae bacterium]|nr:tetratricopeptide repeat protein [Acidobacteriaceae bacterium]
MDKIAMLGEILQQNPTDAFARYGLAMELVSQKKLDAAYAEFERLVELNPDYVPGYQMYAQTLATAARTEEAAGILRRGIACAQRMNNQHAVA